MSIYEDLLGKMQGRYSELAGFMPDESSDINIRLQVLAGELGKLYQSVEELEGQLFPQSSSGVHLDKHGEIWNISRKSASYATGYAVFSRTTPATANLPILIETVVATNTDPAQFFMTTAFASIPIGQTSVRVPIKAQETGVNSSVAAGMIGTIISSVTGITRVTNPEPITGATEVETDQQLRQRILARYQSPSTNSSVGFYYNYAMAHPNVSFAKVIRPVTGSGTAYVVVVAKNAAESASTLSDLTQYYNSNRELCNTVLVKSATVKSVDIALNLEVKDGYTPEDVRVNAREAIAGYLGNMSIGEHLLINHLGFAILKVEGVLNYKISKPTTDTLATDEQVIRLGSINVGLAGG